MGWRDTQAAVSSGQKSFVQKNESFGLAVRDGAKMIGNRWILNAEEEKAEKKQREKEERAARKALKAKQDAQEAKDKKLEENAKYLARTYTNDPTNVEAVQFFHQQLKLMDGDVGDVMSFSDNLIEKGRLNFTPSSTKTETLPFQGPNVPANAEIKDFGGKVGSNTTKDGRDVTLGDLPNIIINDNNSASLKAQASEMNDMFGSLAEGTTLPEPGEVDVTVPGGVELLAAGQEPFKVDVTRVKTLEDIELYRDELEQSGKLSDDAATYLDNRVSALTLKSDTDFVRSLAGKPEDQADQLRAMEALKETASDRYVLLKSLNTAEVENLKPWEPLLKPENLVGKVGSELSQIMNLAKMLKAPDTELALLQSEIDRQAEIPEDLDISSLKTFADWTAFDANLQANPTNTSEVFSEVFNSRGDALFRDFLTTSSVEELNNLLTANPEMEGTKKTTLENALALKQGQAVQELLTPANLAGKKATEIRSLIAIAEQAGAEGKVLADAKAIADEIDKIENTPNYAKYGSKASSHNATLQQISLAESDGAGEAIIGRLVNLAAAQQKAEIAKAQGVPGQKVYESVITLLDDTQSFKLVVEKPSADGTVQYFDSAGKPLVDGKDYKFMRNINEAESTALHKISVQTNKYNQEAQTAKVAIVEGLINSERLLAIAKDDPRVRNAAGDVAQAITNFVRSGSGVLQVMESLFEGQADDYMVTEEQFRAAVAKGAPNASGDLVDAIVSGKVQDLGDKTAMFEASMLSLIFRAGRMEGQSGNAMSNKDFDRLTEMLNVKGGYEAFEQTLRTFMADKITTYNVKAQNLLTGPPNDFKLMYGYLPVSEPTTFSDFVTEFNDPKITQAYQNTVSYSPTATATEEPPEVNNTNLEKFINTGTFNLTIEGGGSSPITRQEVADHLKFLQRQDISDEQKATQIEDFLRGFAKALGTSVENLKAMGGY